MSREFLCQGKKKHSVYFYQRTCAFCVKYGKMLDPAESSPSEKSLFITESMSCIYLSLFTLSMTVKRLPAPLESNCHK